MRRAKLYALALVPVLIVGPLAVAFTLGTRHAPAGCTTDSDCAAKFGGSGGPEPMPRVQTDRCIARAREADAAGQFEEGRAWWSRAAATVYGEPCPPRI